MQNIKIKVRTDIIAPFLLSNKDECNSVSALLVDIVSDYVESSSVVNCKRKHVLSSLQKNFQYSNDMPSRDRNIVNGLYDITNLTWRDLIGAANIPAAVKFYVLRLPRPGRAPRD